MDGWNKLCVGQKDYWTERKDTANLSVSTSGSVISSEEAAEKRLEAAAFITMIHF